MALFAEPQQIEALAAQRKEHAAVAGKSKIRPMLPKISVYRGLMKTDLARAPAIMPKLGLQGL